MQEQYKIRQNSVVLDYTKIKYKDIKYLIWQHSKKKSLQQIFFNTMLLKSVARPDSLMNV